MSIYIYIYIDIDIDMFEISLESQPVQAGPSIYTVTIRYNNGIFEIFVIETLTISPVCVLAFALIACLQEGLLCQQPQQTCCGDRGGLLYVDRE